MDSMQSLSPHVDDFSSDIPGQPSGGSKQPTPQGTTHKRTYQACLPCRERKVRCDLGPVDAPGDPPCQRCRREKKDCVFSNTRRKKRTDNEGSISDDFVIRNKRARTSSNGIDSPSVGNAMHGLSNAYGGVASGISYDDRNGELGIDGGRRRAGNQSVQNQAAAELFSNAIFQPSDAFRMLVDAAKKTEHDDRTLTEPPSSSNKLAQWGSRLGADTSLPHTQSSIDPRIVHMQQTMEADPEMANALQAWSSLRFVRAGWLTAKEGIDYVQYFYEHMAPLSPVSPPDYSSLTSHAQLLNDEPMLTVTILTIASRYMVLTGAGGKTRSFWMHDKLWEYLQGMITRMFWGQEQFGGGFCGAGPMKSVEEAEARRRGLRSLGTVESLLLLSDWLPRSMHFPPGDDGDELMAPAPQATDPSDLANRNNTTGWIEPALRSDRMCWSLVGMAYTLAFELGVFDSLVELKKWTVGPQTKTLYDPERADRIGRMLFVYVSQTCGRLGFPNMMPHQGTETDFDFLKMDVPPGTYSGPYASVTIVDNVQRAWAELTALMRQTNTEMFESKQRTQFSIHTGQYMQFLETFTPILQNWKQRFDQTEIPPKARIMIMMEYEYARIYINSLSLQAVLEKCATSAQEAEENDGPPTAQTPPGLFSSKLVDIYKQNEVYIKELIDAARSLLDLFVNGLRPDIGLKHAPVRTHFRVLSAAMFLLKTFALGGKESEVSRSIHLLDKAIQALRDAVPDDVHLSLRISELLANLTNSLRHKFVRLAVPSRLNKRSASTQLQRPSTSNPSQNGPNPSSLSTFSTGAQAADHRRHSSFSFNQAGSTGAASHEFYRQSLGLVQPPPLVDPNDPNITIMPPPEFINNQGTYDLYGGNVGTSSPHSASGSANVYSRPGSATGAGPTGLDGSSPVQSHSPTLSGISGAGGGGNTAHSQRARHGSGSHHGRGPGNMPFSPQNASGYDWLALDFNPLLNSNLPGHLSNNSGQSGGNTLGGVGNSMGANVGSSLGRGVSPNTQSTVGGASEEANYAQQRLWTGGAFGPEISEGLEWLNALGAVGNITWEDGTAHNSGYAVLE